MQKRDCGQAQKPSLERLEGVRLVSGACAEPLASVREPGKWSDLSWFCGAQLRSFLPEKGSCKEITQGQGKPDPIPTSTTLPPPLP